MSVIAVQHAEKQAAAHGSSRCSECRDRELTVGIQPAYPPAHRATGRTRVAAAIAILTRGAMTDTDRQEPPGWAGPVGAASSVASVAIVWLVRAADLPQALPTIALSRDGGSDTGRAELLIAPWDAAPSGDDESSSVKFAGNVLSIASDVGTAIQLAAESTSAEVLAVVSGPAPLAALELNPDLLSLAAAGRVVLQDRAITPGDWRTQTTNWIEQRLTRLLYGSHVAATQGVAVMAQRDAWRACGGSPLTPTECVASLVDRGVDVVRCSTSATRKLSASPFSGWWCALGNWSALVRDWWQRRRFPGATATESEATPLVAWRWAVLLLLAAFVLFANLNTPLLEPDEGRHAEITREMWTTGNWLAPQFQHEPYLDKPPLLYWLSCASFAVFGVHDWSTRLVTAGCGLITVCSVYGFGRRLIGDRAAWMGATILLLSLGFVACARFLILESLLTMGVVTSLLLGALADRKGRWQWGWWLASATACGIGLLTKGPIAAVLVMPPLAMSQWLGGSPGPSFWRRWFPYGAIAAGMALPWFVAVIITRPEFLRYFFWEHNLNRFLSGTNHEHSLLFYVPVLLIGLIPWSLLLFPAVGFACSGGVAKRPLRSPQIGFLLLWSAWCLGFFTIAAGKLPYYILSCLPALALLMGYYLDRVVQFWSDAPSTRLTAMLRMRRGSWMVALSGLGTAPVMMFLELTTPPAALGMTLLWMALLAAVLRLPVNRSPLAAWGLFCLMAAVSVAQLTQIGLAGWQRKHAILPTSEVTLAKLRDPRMQIICVGATWGSVPFYLQRDDVSCIEVSELPQLAAAIDPTRPAILLIEYKLPLESIVPLLPPGMTHAPIDATRRVVYAELQPVEVTPTLTVDPSPPIAPR
jgi:dolichol-phosphate mannosyltransferase